MPPIPPAHPPRQTGTMNGTPAKPATHPANPRIVPPMYAVEAIFLSGVPSIVHIVPGLEHVAHPDARHITTTSNSLISLPSPSSRDTWHTDRRIMPRSIAY